MDYQQWVSKNCRFAADIQNQAPPTTAPVPSIVTQPRDYEQELQGEMPTPLNQVFSHLAENIDAYKSAVGYSQDQNFPSFKDAYVKAFGNVSIQEVTNCLDRLNAYLQAVAQNPKFKQAPKQPLQIKPRQP